MGKFLYPLANPEEKRDLPKIDFRVGYQDRIKNELIKNLKNEGYELIYADMRASLRILVHYDKNKVKNWIQEYPLFEVRIIEMRKGIALIEVVPKYKVRNRTYMEVMYNKLYEVMMEIHTEE